MGITKNGSKAMKQQSGIVKEEQVSVVVEKNNVEYKTYFHCINCNTDIFKNTEAFDHLERKHKININLKEAFQTFFVIKEIERSISNTQTIQDNLKRKMDITENGSRVAQENVEIEIFFHCVICKVDIYQKTEAVKHLETYHRIMMNLEATFKKMFVIKEIKKEVANKKSILSNYQAFHDDLKRGKYETPNQLNSNRKKIKVAHGGSKNKVSHYHRGKVEHNIPWPSKCDFCEHLFSRSRDLNAHIKRVHEGRSNYKCDHCGKSFIRSRNLNTHLKAVHEGKSNYKCDDCEQSFLISKKLASHTKRVHEGQRNYKCNHCEKYFTRSRGMNIHTKTIHERQRNYECDDCKQSFTRSRNLKIHIKTVHEGQRNEKCDFCGKYFTKQRNLRIHIKTVHEGQRNHKCNGCKQSFTRSRKLKIHFKIVHEGQRNYRCNLCEKSFTLSRKLISHTKRVHEGQRNYKCNHCKKYFTRSRGMKIHVKTVHEGQKNYKCDHCENYFTGSRNLKIHIKTVHEGQKNYKCNNCQQSFTTSRHLNSHIKRVHEGQSNHKCDICWQSFTKSRNLNTHIKALHEGQRNYKCDYCEQCFPRSRNLKNHVTRVHEMNLGNNGPNNKNEVPESKSKQSRLQTKNVNLNMGRVIINVDPLMIKDQYHMQFPHLTDDQLNGCTQANMMQIQKYAFTGNKAEYDKLYYRQEMARAKIASQMYPGVYSQAHGAREAPRVSGSDLSNAAIQHQQYQKLLQIQRAHAELKRQQQQQAAAKLVTLQASAGGARPNIIRKPYVPKPKPKPNPKADVSVVTLDMEQPSDELREIARDLECPVCFNVAKPPIYQCEEGHIICHQCKPNLEKCPSCSKKYSEPAIRNRLAEKISDKYSAQLSKYE